MALIQVSEILQFIHIYIYIYIERERETKAITDIHLVHLQLDSKFFLHSSYLHVTLPRQRGFLSLTTSHEHFHGWHRIGQRWW
jgi:hypothetical protein